MILFPGALEVITKPVQIRWKRTNTYTILYCKKAMCSINIILFT